MTARKTHDPHREPCTLPHPDIGDRSMIARCAHLAGVGYLVVFKRVMVPDGGGPPTVGGFWPDDGGRMVQVLAVRGSEGILLTEKEIEESFRGLEATALSYEREGLIGAVEAGNVIAREWPR